MPTIEIQDFSCIKQATIEVKPINIIIGEQGSGKSVSAKLLYFMISILGKQYSAAEAGLSLDDFKKRIRSEFGQWFPIDAWGSNRFKITLRLGSNSIRLMRNIKNGIAQDSFNISISDQLEEHYNDLLKSFKITLRSEDADEDGLDFVSSSLDASYEIIRKSQNQLRRILGKEYVRSQTFIPANRSSFTTMGKLLAAFDQTIAMDPATAQFAKMLARLRDSASRRSLMSRRLREANAGVRISQSLFGGELQFDTDGEFVLTEDGRRIPFQALSSGQQELIPIWLPVIYFTNTKRSRIAPKELFYIEEPEAHLFPRAQSDIIQFLISRLLDRFRTRYLFMTTHSPYILMKINNLLKAGSIGKSSKNLNLVKSIVPQSSWISRDDITALAIRDGFMSSIVDEFGMIDTKYIDEVSQIEEKIFDKLLDIEFPETSDEF